MATRAQLLAEIDNAIQEWCSHEMRWGLSDCALAIADIYRIALGVDPAEEFRGRYRTKIGAARLIAKGGLPRAVAGACRRLGWPRIKRAEALPGDLGLVRCREEDDTRIYLTCAIRHQQHWVFPRHYGFAAAVDQNVGAAWRVNVGKL